MPPTPWDTKTVRYPEARRSEHVDVYKSAAKGEVRVHDPYQWLEAHSAETDAWTTAQEAFARAYLDQNPDRDALQKAFTESYNYAKVRGLCMLLTRRSLTRDRARSSPRHSASRTRPTRGGTGGTIAGCRLNPVCTPSLSTLLVLTRPRTVLYRSKDGRLPDFSADKEPGEVFFDVRLSAILSCMYIASPF